jgi:hypothetical protein
LWSLRITICVGNNNTFCVVVVIIIFVVVAVVVDIHVTVNYVKILSVTQICFYGKFTTENNKNFTFQFSI